MIIGETDTLPATGQLPIIRAPRGNAAEMVARKLDSRLRDHMASSRGVNAFSGGVGGDGSFGRPREFSLLLVAHRICLSHFEERGRGCIGG